jgi:murein DD-endopeptidase MepM/ murein hydrolase activator NlpD
MKRMHPVVEKDTLGKISKMYGVPVAELININHLDNPNKLKIGQRIFLDSDEVLSFQALLLDRDRNPIGNQRYKLEFCGKIVKGSTGASGLTEKILTETPHDEVQVAIERLDKSFKVVARALSGYGTKLVTVLSPRVKIEGNTEEHPVANEEQVPSKTKKPLPIFPPNEKKTATAEKKALGLKTAETKTPDGKPLVKVEGDIPNMEFLDDFNGEVMGEEDYVWAAKELGVEKAAIKAFAIVESGGAGFFKISKRTVPKILYERHKFAKLTGNKYSKLYPDISLPNAYYNNMAKYVLADEEYKKKRGVARDIEYYRPVVEKDGAAVKASASSLAELLVAKKVTAEKDKYLDLVGSYKRLIKAYQLDKSAALESCSWGAFQIMGEYWDTMKYASVQDFCKAVSRSPREQIKTFVAYIKYVNPAIKIHLKNLDWAATAAAYNGPRYKDYKYDVKLEAAYKKFKGEK